MPSTRFNDAELLTVTQLLVPLNDKALPYFPVVQVALVVVPLLFWPEASATELPLFSLRPRASTNPLEGAGVLVRVGVRVGVNVDVLVRVGVGVNVGVLVDDGMSVPVGVGVKVESGVDVLVGSGVTVGVSPTDPKAP